MRKNIYEIYNTHTGEPVEHEEYEQELKRESKIKYGALMNKFERRPDDMTVDEIEFIIGNRRNVKLDYSKDGYFSVKVNNDTLSLDIRTRGLLFSLGEYMSNEGRLVYKNGRAIKTIKDIKKHLCIKEGDWKRYIKPDVDKYNLIKKDTVDGRDYFILNPLFLFKGRKISETVFIAFHKELEEYLSDIEYLYLCKKYNIKP